MLKNVFKKLFLILLFAITINTKLFAQEQMVQKSLRNHNSPYTIEKIRTIYEKTETKPPTYAEKRARAKAAKESEAIILNPEYQSAEYQNELQMEIDNFDRYSDKPYTYRMTPGRVVDWGRDVPPKVEKVDISTPEKIRDSDLPVEMKLKLLKTRFGYD